MNFFKKYKKDYAALLRLGFPILIGQLGMIVVGFADNIMVGHYSTPALASASFVNNLFNVIIFCCIGFTYGLTPIIGSLFGQKRYEAIGVSLRSALTLNVLFTLVLTGVMTAVYFNLSHLGQPDELLPLIRPYYLIYLAGLLPISIFNVFAQWCYGIKNTKIPMWIILASNVMNIIGNYALIFGHFGAPELGLTGAGISTLIARMVCPLTMAAYFIFHKGNYAYRHGFAIARNDRRLFAKIWKISIPISMQMTFESGSFTAAAIMTGWISAIDLAAFQIIVIIGTLGFCIYYSIGSAVTILVSNEAGKSDSTAMRRVAWAGYHILLALMICSSAIFIFYGKPLMGCFSDDPQVLAIAGSLIFPLVMYQAGDATQINFASALRGTSHVMPMLWIAFVSYVAIGIPATYLLGFTFGLGSFGIILSFSVSLFLAGALFLYYFLKATRD